MAAHQITEEKKRPSHNKYAISCTVLASMTSILMGYDIGVMSGAALYIKEELRITDVQLEIMSGMINLCALVGSAMAGKTSDLVGRRYTMVIAGVIFFAGALFMGFAPNYALLVFGRFIAGVGIGFALVIAPVYAAEVAPASSRGFLTSFPEVFINLGILLGYVSNVAFSKLPLHLGWRFMLGIGAVPSVFLAVVVIAMPESPRWLVMQGRIGEAKCVLGKTSDSPQEAEQRLADIKDAAGIAPECHDDVVTVNAHKSHGEGVWRELLISPTPTVRHVLIAVLSINFFQQASGIDAVVLYSPRIFETAGIKTAEQKLLATVAVGIVKTLAILVATFFLDKVGRRPLLLSSHGGMVVSLLLLASSLTVVDHHMKDKVPQWAIVVCVAMVLIYVAFFSIGSGPIVWVYGTEVWPLRLRAQGASLAVALNRVTSGVIGMTFLSLAHALTTGGAFFLFAGITTFSFILYYLILPETLGKSLEETASLFGSLTGWKAAAKELELKNKAEKGHQV
ncbi:hypothetical protein MLD38_040125 [Melastoma candidum]|uniref:Uncharacterized protein n=1 Tax=Melastoma candidum TaxID=119954 RepID=A0ACB9L4A0_9MYRT|nr:hypothetical protein MLD38_040125 [Melastoma candidum]